MSLLTPSPLQPNGNGLLLSADADGDDATVLTVSQPHCLLNLEARLKNKDQVLKESSVNISMTLYFLTGTSPAKNNLKYNLTIFTERERQEWAKI